MRLIAKSYRSSFNDDEVVYELRDEDNPKYKEKCYSLQSLIDNIVMKVETRNK